VSFPLCKSLNFEACAPSSVSRISQSSCTSGATSIAVFPGYSYGPPTMNPGVRHRLSRWIAAPRVAVAAGLALCALSTAACAHSRSLASVRRVGGTLPSASPVAGLRASRSLESSQILSAWWAAQEAFDTAALTADPDQPSLAATTVSPQLDLNRLFLEQMAAAGELGQGSVDNGHPRVVAIDGDVATVRSCVDDSEIAVIAATGQPVPGILGEKDFALFTSTMQQGTNGWKLSSQTAGVGQCD
jgi:hypothetical protein